VTRIALVSITLAVVLAASAGATTIADVVGAPASYSGQHVTVVGTVATPRAAYAGETVYTLSDGRLRITVFGYGTAPAVGDRVQVDARVGWHEGDEEFTWPPVLFESARQPAP
jgi:starvation-inducible outer membrane lipoprotein